MDRDKLLAGIFILILVGSFGFKIFSLGNTPIGFDEGAISYIAKEMAGGKTLYLDYFDHKSPIMHYVLSFVFKFVTPTDFSIKLIALVFDTILLVSIFFVARSFLGNRYGLLSAAIYSVLNLSLGMYGEVLMSIFGVWALFFYIKAIKEKDLVSFNIFLAGIFVAIAIWVKQSALFFYLPFVFHIFYLSYKGEIDKKEGFESVLLLTLGVLLVSIPLLSYFLYKVGFYFFYAIIKFNLEFSAPTSRLFQIGKGIGILLFYLGPLIAISLFSFKDSLKEEKGVGSLLIIFNIVILGFLFVSSEIFYQHFFQLIPFTIFLAIFGLKNSNKKIQFLMILVILFGVLTVGFTALEDKARDLRAGDVERHREVLSYLNESVPRNSKFFADNPIYTVLGNYSLNQSIVGSAPSFNSVFDYSFVCDLDYLVLTHRKSFLTDEEMACIIANYSLEKRFENVGESFVEIWKSN